VKRPDRLTTGMALANLDCIQGGIYYCAVTGRPVHLEHWKDIAV